MTLFEVALLVLAFACVALTFYMYGFGRGSEAERTRVADGLREQASMRFDVEGPMDQRGAAFWDVSAALVESDRWKATRARMSR